MVSFPSPVPDLASKIVPLQMQVDDIREGTVKEPVGAPDSPR